MCAAIIRNPRKKILSESNDLPYLKNCGKIDTTPNIGLVGFFVNG